MISSPGINIEEVDEQRLTPLHMAAVFGHYDCANTLIQAHADLTATDEKGQTVLHKVPREGE